MTVSCDLQVGRLDGLAQLADQQDEIGEPGVQAFVEYFVDAGVAQAGFQFGSQALGRAAVVAGQAARSTGPATATIAVGSGGIFGKGGGGSDSEEGFEAVSGSEDEDEGEAGGDGYGVGVGVDDEVEEKKPAGKKKNARARMLEELKAELEAEKQTMET